MNFVESARKDVASVGDFFKPLLSTRFIATMVTLMELFVAVIIINASQNPDVNTPFLLAMLGTGILFLFAQGVFDISKANIDTQMVKISSSNGDVPIGNLSSAVEEHGFLSRKLLTFLFLSILFNVLFYRGLVLPYIFVALLETIYILWVFADGAININKVSIDTKFLKIIGDPNYKALDPDKAIVQKIVDSGGEVVTSTDIKEANSASVVVIPESGEVPPVTESEPVQKIVDSWRRSSNFYGY